MRLLQIAALFWDFILMLLIAVTFGAGNPIAGVILLIVFGAFQYAQGDAHLW